MFCPIVSCINGVEENEYTFESHNNLKLWTLIESTRWKIFSRQLEEFPSVRQRRVWSCKKAKVFCDEEWPNHSGIHSIPRFWGKYSTAYGSFAANYTFFQFVTKSLGIAFLSLFLFSFNLAISLKKSRSAGCF